MPFLLLFQKCFLWALIQMDTWGIEETFHPKCQVYTEDQPQHEGKLPTLGLGDGSVGRLVCLLGSRVACRQVDKQIQRRGHEVGNRMLHKHGGGEGEGERPFPFGFLCWGHKKQNKTEKHPDCLLSSGSLPCPHFHDRTAIMRRLDKAAPLLTRPGDSESLC